MPKCLMVNNVIKMVKTIIVSQLFDFHDLKIQLNERWIELMENSNAFRYKLNNIQQKTLDGRLKFILQVNNKK